MKHDPLLARASHAPNCACPRCRHVRLTGYRRAAARRDALWLLLGAPPAIGIVMAIVAHRFWLEHPAALGF